MLKKTLSNLGHIALMLVLGFTIYYYFLSPNLLNSKNTSSEFNALSTQSIFAAKLPNENGMTQNLSHYKGKIIVLNFWATWCPPCREEMPELSELNIEYKNRNVVVLGIAVDELGLVKEFSNSTPVSYQLLVAENDGMALGENLGNNKGVLPYTVIINQEGKVVNTFFGRINKSLLLTTLSTLFPH
jgi:thiol-disulfide isomerase/thioredoxin